MTSRGYDIRDVLGMKRWGVWLVLVGYLVAIWVPIVASRHEFTWLVPPLTGGVLISAMAIAVVIIPGDPMPLCAACMTVAAGPVATALVLMETPTSKGNAVTVSHSAVIGVYVFVILRGGRVLPWCGLAAMAGVYAWWGTRTGQSPIGAALMLVFEIGPLVIGVLLSSTLRSTAREVFSLREQITDDVGKTAAESAAADERAQQVHYLDATARPLLELIATGAPLADAQRLDCEVLEAHLRDRMRAPLMTELHLGEPVYRARVRGVDVVLIDDSGRDRDDVSDAFAVSVAEAISLIATEVLDDADDGEVFIRIPPPGRGVAASILHRGADGASRRVEVADDGQVRLAG
ncbi:hypothetical protein ABLE92_12285 [Gordonia sp. VNQ95]|uniref:hypothetical protein n=1 Tax=Gordonia sp. VNQ95 TaxID=3156619 RepID=UPI0032B3E7F2